MAKKAVLVYTIDWYAERETNLVVPTDHDHYSEIITYVSLISQPDDNLLAESDDYDIIAAYEITDHSIQSLSQSYDIPLEVIEY